MASWVTGEQEPESWHNRRQSENADRITRGRKPHRGEGPGGFRAEGFGEEEEGEENTKITPTDGKNRVKCWVCF
jgi:hypothetical protein